MSVMSQVRHVNAMIAQAGLWKGICWGIAILAMIDGSTYFVKGNNVATGPSFYVLKNQFGGLRFYGAAMLIIAGLAIYASAVRGRCGRYIMVGIFVFSFWVCLEIAVGLWQANKGFAPGNLSKWFFVMWAAIWLAGTAEHPPRR
jgi:hypothetical protein